MVAARRAGLRLQPGRAFERPLVDNVLGFWDERVIDPDGGNQDCREPPKETQFWD
jgi:hypothetical protein